MSKLWPASLWLASLSGELRSSLGPAPAVTCRRPVARSRHRRPRGASCGGSSASRSTAIRVSRAALGRSRARWRRSAGRSAPAGVVGWSLGARWRRSAGRSRAGWLRWAGRSRIGRRRSAVRAFTPVAARAPGGRSRTCWFLAPAGTSGCAGTSASRGSGPRDRRVASRPVCAAGVARTQPSGSAVAPSRCRRLLRRIHGRGGAAARSSLPATRLPSR